MIFVIIVLVILTSWIVRASDVFTSKGSNHIIIVSLSGHQVIAKQSHSTLFLDEKIKVKFYKVSKQIRAEIFRLMFHFAKVCYKMFCNKIVSNRGLKKSIDLFLMELNTILETVVIVC